MERIIINHLAYAKDLVWLEKEEDNLEININAWSEQPAILLNFITQHLD